LGSTPPETSSPIIPLPLRSIPSYPEDAAIILESSLIKAEI